MSFTFGITQQGSHNSTHGAYTTGIGVLKNTLDWAVGCAESIYDKPVALLNASSRATIAYENIKTMGGDIINAASKMIPLDHSNMTK